MAGSALKDLVEKRKVQGNSVIQGLSKTHSGYNGYHTLAAPAALPNVNAETIVGSAVEEATGKLSDQYFKEKRMAHQAYLTQAGRSAGRRAGFDLMDRFENDFSKKVDTATYEELEEWLDENRTNASEGLDTASPFYSSQFNNQYLSQEDTIIGIFKKAKGDRHKELVQRDSLSEIYDHMVVSGALDNESRTERLDHLRRELRAKGHTNKEISGMMIDTATSLIADGEVDLYDQMFGEWTNLDHNPNDKASQAKIKGPGFSVENRKKLEQALRTGKAKNLADEDRAFKAEEKEKVAQQVLKLAEFDSTFNKMLKSGDLSKLDSDVITPLKKAIQDGKVDPLKGGVYLKAMGAADVKRHQGKKEALAAADLNYNQQMRNHKNNPQMQSKLTEQYEELVKSIEDGGTESSADARHAMQTVGFQDDEGTVLELSNKIKAGDPEVTPYYLIKQMANGSISSRMYGNMLSLLNSRETKEMQGRPSDQKEAISTALLAITNNFNDKSTGMFGVPNKIKDRLKARFLTEVREAKSVKEITDLQEKWLSELNDMNMSDVNREEGFLKNTIMVDGPEKNKVTGKPIKVPLTRIFSVKQFEHERNLGTFETAGYSPHQIAEMRLRVKFNETHLDKLFKRSEAVRMEHERRMKYLEEELVKKQEWLKAREADKKEQARMLSRDPNESPGDAPGTSKWYKDSDGMFTTNDTITPVNMQNPNVDQAIANILYPLEGILNPTVDGLVVNIVSSLHVNKGKTMSDSDLSNLYSQLTNP